MYEDLVRQALPVDRNGVALKAGDSVQVFNADGTLLGEAQVLGFDPSPSYDQSCVGIFVNTQTGSIHPRLVELLSQEV